MWLSFLPGTCLAALPEAELALFAKYGCDASLSLMITDRQIEMSRVVSLSPLGKGDYHVHAGVLYVAS